MQLLIKVPVRGRTTRLAVVGDNPAVHAQHGQLLVFFSSKDLLWFTIIVDTGQTATHQRYTNRCITKVEEISLALSYQLGRRSE